MALDPEQLAAASLEERTRALRSARQAVLREAARVAREAALTGDDEAVAARRAQLVALLPQDVIPEVAVPEGVVVND